MRPSDRLTLLIEYVIGLAKRPPPQLDGGHPTYECLGITGTVPHSADYIPSDALLSPLGLIALCPTFRALGFKGSWIDVISDDNLPNWYSYLCDENGEHLSSLSALMKPTDTERMTYKKVRPTHKLVVLGGKGIDGIYRVKTHALTHLSHVIGVPYRRLISSFCLTHGTGWFDDDDFIGSFYSIDKIAENLMSLYHECEYARAFRS